MRKASKRVPETIKRWQRAASRVRGSFRLCYVAGPFRAPTPWQVEQNVRRAEEWSVVVARAGWVPVCSHTMYRHFDELDGVHSEFWLGGTLELLRRCDAVVFVPGWMYSKGSCGEYALGNKLGMPMWFPGPPDEEVTVGVLQSVMACWLLGQPKKT